MLILFSSSLSINSTYQQIVPILFWSDWYLFLPQFLNVFYFSIASLIGYQQLNVRGFPYRELEIMYIYSPLKQRFNVIMILKFSANPVIEKYKTNWILFNKDSLNSDSILPIILNGQKLQCQCVSGTKHVGN